MEKKNSHSHEDCDCDHHKPEGHSHPSKRCPTESFVENLLKDLELENKEKKK